MNLILTSLINKIMSIYSTDGTLTPESDSVDDLLLDFDDDETSAPIEISEGCKNIIEDYKSKFNSLITNFADDFHNQNYSELFEHLVLDTSDSEHFKVQISDLQIVIDRLKRELAEQKSDTEHFKELSVTLKSDFLQSKTNNKIKSDNISLLEDKLGQIREHNRILSEDLKLYKTKTQQSATTIESLILENQKIKSSLKEAEIAEDESLNQLEDALETIRQADKSIRKYKKTINVHQATIVQLSLESEQLSLESSTLKKEKDELKQSHTKSIQTKDLEIEVHKQTVSKLEQDITKLTKQLKESESRLSKIEDENYSLKDSQKMHNLDILSLVCENKKLEMESSLTKEVPEIKPKKSPKKKNIEMKSRYNLRTRNT